LDALSYRTLRAHIFLDSLIRKIEALPPPPPFHDNSQFLFFFIACETFYYA
jgi:hypothetical protein